MLAYDRVMPMPTPAPVAPPAGILRCSLCSNKVECPSLELLQSDQTQLIVCCGRMMELYSPAVMPVKAPPHTRRADPGRNTADSNLSHTPCGMTGHFQRPSAPVNAGMNWTDQPRPGVFVLPSTIRVRNAFPHAEADLHVDGPSGQQDEWVILSERGGKAVVLGRGKSMPDAWADADKNVKAMGM